MVTVLLEDGRRQWVRGREAVRPESFCILSHFGGDARENLPTPSKGLMDGSYRKYRCGPEG